ncbi:MAG: sensor histidine kinase [Bacteroidota bacterium]
MLRRKNFLNVAMYCILQCIATSVSRAQHSGGVFYHLTTKNGLSSNRVNAVIQDREGFYWIATQDGLNRFDGSNCRMFRSNKNDSTSLSHNDCRLLLEDDKGDIWIATPRAVNRYVKKTGKFERYYLSHPSVLADRLTIRGMVKDEAGNIWVTSVGLWQYNIYSRQWTRYLHEPANPASVPEGFNYLLQYDRFNKGLWMSNDGLTFFNIAEKKFHHKAHNPKNIFPFRIAPADGIFVLDSLGTIWFYNDPELELSNYSFRDKRVRSFPAYVSKGVYSCSVDELNRIWFNHWSKSTAIYDPATNKMDTLFLAPTHQQSPLTDIATHLYIDITGNYFISSSKGVSIYNPRAQAVRYFWLTDKRKPEPGVENTINCLAEQNESIVWVGTGAALFRYDFAQNKTKAIENLPLSSPIIRCLYIHKDSVLWIGGWSEILLFDLRSERVLKKISLDANPQFIMAGSPGQIWVGTWAQGLFKFSNTGQITERIVQQPDQPRSLLYNGLPSFVSSATEPCFWIGYNYEYGFFKLNYTNHTIENFKIPAGTSFNSVYNSINAIAEDKQGNLWLGSYGGGLTFFDRRKNRFTNYTRSDGLSGDYVNKILPDAGSNIWVTTSNGLSIIDGRTHSIMKSEIDLSFPDNDFRANGIVRKNGKLLFFSGLKLVEIDPVAYLQSTYPSEILLSNFKIFEKETPLPVNKKGEPGIHLSYRQNFFSLEYSLLKSNPDASTQYAYKLDGFDKDWNHVRERRIAYYTNVPPGRYTFSVKATDESGKWLYFSGPVVITITPPFWKTWWFYLLCGIMAALTVFYVVSSRINQFKKRQREQLRLVVATQEQEKKNISAELHDDLGVRLSALKYFVTSLKDYLQPGNPMATETYSKTLEVIDESVEDIRYLLVNLSPKTLNEYGYLMAVEDLVNKLRKLHIIDIELKQKGIEGRLPADIESGLYRITQELINNTLKHAGATAIQLQIEQTAGFIRLQYEDNGKGFNTALPAQGYGMQNIQTRVTLLNGKTEWDTGINKPAKVIIEIPYNHT